MNLIEAINKEAILIGVEQLNIKSVVDMAIISDIERICRDLNVPPDELDSAFFLNKTGKFADNNSDYVRAFGKINSKYISEIILCFKKWQIDQNKRVKEYKPNIALPISKEAEKQALKRGFELAKENIIREFKNGKDKFYLATKWVHSDYYQFVQNDLSQEEKEDYLEYVSELVRQNKIKEYQSLYEVPIPREQENYISTKTGKIENYAKCLWVTEQIINQINQ